MYLYAVIEHSVVAKLSHNVILFLFFAIIMAMI